MEDYNLLCTFLDGEIRDEKEYLDALNYILGQSSKFSRRIIYSVAVQLDEDFNSNKRVEVTNLINGLKNTSVELENKKNMLKGYMMKKVPNCFYNDNITGETDIVHFTPLERHVRGLDDFQHNDGLGDTYHEVIRLLCLNRDNTRKIFNYISLYLQLLTMNMQYLKSQILKFEFANQFDFEKCVVTEKGETTSGYVRKGRHSGTPLDSIINCYMDDYMALNNEFCKFLKELKNCDVDYEMMRYNSHVDSNSLMEKFHGFKFDYSSNIPLSVIKEIRV